MAVKKKIFLIVGAHQLTQSTIDKLLGLKGMEVKVVDEDTKVDNDEPSDDCFIKENKHPFSKFFTKNNR